MSGIVAWTLKQPDKTASGPVSKGCVHAPRGGSEMMGKEELCRLLLMFLKKQETNIYEYLTCTLTVVLAPLFFQDVVRPRALSGFMSSTI